MKTHFQLKSRHRPRHTFMQDTGFTLIELMITLGIIGIVVSVAIAAYGDYSKRVADEYGKMVLNEVMAQQKVAFIHKRRYADNFTAIGYTNEVVESEYGYYRVSLSTCGTEKLTRCVIATATPLTEKTSDTILSLDSNGERLPLDAW